MHSSEMSVIQRNHSQVNLVVEQVVGPLCPVTSAAELLQKKYTRIDLELNVYLGIQHI